MIAHDFIKFLQWQIYFLVGKLINFMPLETIKSNIPFSINGKPAFIMFDIVDLLFYNFNMNLVPEFIIKKYAEGENSGFINSVILSVDIVGFTKIADELAKHGKKSVEELSNIINNVFGKSINIVYRNYGWVSSFTGDGFIGIFPIEKCINAISAAKEINLEIHNTEIKTRYGKFVISIRSGLSSGKIRWGIIRTTHGNYYYIEGNPLRNSVRAQKRSKPGQIILQKCIIKKCGSDIDTRRKDKYFILENINKGITITSEMQKDIFDESTIEEFVPLQLKKVGTGGEFRYITSLFLYFKNKDEIGDFIVKISELVNKFNGFLNKIDFADKGNTMLILFGAPVALEKPALNALEFAYKVREQFGGEVKMGVGEGVAYTGVIGIDKRCEYTAIGEIVNMSSRIGEKIKWGKIYVSENVYKNSENRFNFVSLGERKFKGINRGVKIYDMKDRKSLTEKLYPGEAIGRKNEIASIVSLIDEVRKEKSGKIVYIEGVAGVGKSRLLMEVKKRISPDEFDWLYLPCDNILRESLNPLLYFIKRHFLSDNKDDYKKNEERFNRIYNNLIKKTKNRNLRDELKRYYPFIANFAGIATIEDVHSNMSPVDIYKNTLHGLLALLKTLSNFKTLIIEFEDIHWIDSDSVNFLNLLIKNIEQFPIVLILIGRPTENNKIKELIKGNIRANVMRIGTLNKVDCKQLVNSVIGAPASDEIIDIIWNKGEGNPFYIEQIAMYLVEKKIIRIENGKYVLKEKLFDVPESISNIIISRIDKLETKLKNTVKTASILGRQFSVMVLIAMLKNNVNLSELKRVENKDIWKIINDITGIFKHALIRDAVYNMQLEKTLRRLHKAAAEAIEKLYSKDIGNHVSELAYHYYEAEEYDKAKKYLSIAARRAMEQYQNSDALELYEKLLYIESDKKKIAEIKLNIGEIFRRTGKWKQAIEIIRKTLKSVEKLNDKYLMAKYNEILAVIYENTERIKDAEELARKSLSLFKDIGYDAGVSRAMNILGTIYYHRAEYKKAIDLFNKKLKIDKEIGFKKGYYSALSRLGLIYFDYGKFSMALKMFKENLEFARQSGNLAIESHMLGDIGLVYWKEKKYKKAIKNFIKVFEISRKLGDMQSEAEAVNNLGIVYEEMGDYNNALKYLEHGYKLCKEVGDKLTLGYTTGNLGLVYFYKGDFKRAIKNFEMTRRIAEATNDPLSRALAFLSLGDVYMMKGDFKRALVSVENSIDIYSRIKMDYMLSSAYCLYARILKTTGDYKKSVLMLEKAEKALNKSPRDDVRFSCLILKNELLSDKKKAVENLMELAKHTDDKNNKADIYYSIFLITKDKTIARRAFNLYTKLYESLHKYIFKKRINELEEFLKK